MSRSVALTTEVDKQLRTHLLQHLHDEDLCFAVWRPSRGSDRLTALVAEPILPLDGEREVHGDASFSSDYFMRAAGIAAETDAGLVFLHSHTRRSRGWQGMSGPDVEAETKYAPRAKAMTQMPLLGMTLGGDGGWSARFWEKSGPGRYDRIWAENVRVVGDRMKLTYHDEQRPPPDFRRALTRTVSAWGPETQADLARLRIGIIGAGSVGSIVAEALARTGIEHLRLIDFDTVKEINLDRLVHARQLDAQLARSKVDTLARGVRASATAAHPRIDALDLTVVEEDGFRAALDCDLLFSCVDRPWPRAVLNLIAYAHLIPVVDGGIRVRTTGSKILSADWKAHVAAPSRRCMECLGQFDPSLVTADRQGLLDDPSYMAGLPADHPARANENVFGFSLGAASLEVLQLFSMVTSPSGMADFGAQNYHFKTGTLDLETEDCEPTCWYSHRLVGLGDHANIPVTGKHDLAERERSERRDRAHRLPVRIARRADDLVAAISDRLTRAVAHLS